MKKIVERICRVLLIVAVVAYGIIPASAGNFYSVGIPTYTITEVGALSTARIAATTKIGRISASNNAEIAQTITMYEKGSSTTTVTALGYWNLPASSGTYSLTGEGFIPLNDRKSVSYPIFRKSSTGSTVYIQVWY